VLFKARVTFKQHIPKKHNSGTKIYKLCNTTIYTYNMNVYLGKNKQNVTQVMKATHMTVKGVSHKLYMNNFFFCPDIFDDMHTHKQYQLAWEVRQNCNGIPRGLDKKTLKLKYDDMC